MTRTTRRHDDGPIPSDYALRTRQQRERLTSWLAAIAVVLCVLLIIWPGLRALVTGGLPS